MAARTVLERKERSKVKPLNNNAKLIAPKNAIKIIIPGIALHINKKTICAKTAPKTANGKMVMSFAKKIVFGETGANCKSSNVFRSRSPANASAANGNVIVEFIAPRSKSKNFIKSRGNCKKLSAFNNRTPRSKKLGNKRSNTNRGSRIRSRHSCNKSTLNLTILTR